MLMHVLRSVGIAAVVVALTAVAYFVLSRGMTVMERWHRLPPTLAVAGRRVLRWIAVAVAVLMVLQALHVIENAWTAVTAAFALLAIAFAAVWSILNHALCAIILMVTRPFDIGDTVELPDVELKGKAIDFNLMFTTLRADDGGMIQVPNNLFFQKPLKRMAGAAPVALDEQLSRGTPTE